MLDQMVASGRLPHFARLYREGSVGAMSTREAGLPPLSPRIWTSIATGQLPPVHGLVAFVFEDDAQQKFLYSSEQRKAPAAWEIASAAGKSVGVVNWWFTYPAENVNGFVISDRYLLPRAKRYAKFYGGKFERETTKIVFPEALAATLAPSTSQSTPLVVNAATAEQFDRGIFALSYAALAEQPVDFLVIYTRALDELSHMRWNTHEPRPGDPPTTDEIAEYLTRYDVMLGELIARLTPRDHLLIVSDHGFERNTGQTGPQGTHVSPRTAVGTLILHGPRVAPAHRVRGATLLDVLPTALELLGIPPARNMPGKVLRRAFRPESQELLPRAAAYTRSSNNHDAATGVKLDPATQDRLRALGYLE